MATRKEKAKQAKNNLPQNTNRQTISRRILSWLQLLNVVGSADSPNDIDYIWSGTQSQYDDLSTIDNQTLYFIEE